MLTPIVITPPDVPVVTLDEAKAHLRVDFSDDDVLITRLIATAIKWIDAPEGKLGRALIAQTLELRLMHFSHMFSHENMLEHGFVDRGWVSHGHPHQFETTIRLPCPNLIGVDSVSYTDTDGNPQTLDPSGYRVFGVGGRGHVAPAYGQAWPAARFEPEAVRIRFQAGYGDEAEDVPENIRHAILLLVGHLYENREAEVVGLRAAAIELPTGVNALLSTCMVYD